MKYMGSKSRIVKELAPIIQQYVDLSAKGYYYEPFCGGCNVIDHISAKRRFAADKQKYLISLYQNLHRLDQLPANVTKEHYSAVRDSYNRQDRQYEDWYVGAIGFLASYNGRFFDGGYAGIVHTKAGTVKDYYAEAKRNLEAQVPMLDGIVFGHRDYRETNDISGFVIYCDPPYKDTKQYGSSKNFNHDEFWEWVRLMSVKNIVLVSEFQAPDDFEYIWEQPITRTIDNTKRVKSVERLFKKSVPELQSSSPQKTAESWWR